jgi:pimeloyl-ACP methyl ester carboxylesterase
MHVTACGSGSPVLFIHGMPTSGRLWDGVIERLSGSFRCIAVDLPGFGKSPRALHTISDLETIAHYLDRIRSEHNFERWHVVGHDAGSVVAVHYARCFPERVGSMALLAPALFPELKPYFLLEPLRKPLIGEFFAPLICRLFWKIVMNRALEDMEDGDRLLLDFYEPFTGRAGALAFMRIVRWGKPSVLLADVPGFLPKLSMPTRIFHGANDVVVPASFAKRAGSLMPNASVVTLDCGHFIPLNRPARVASDLLRFFRATGICGAGVKAAPTILENQMKA